MKQNHTDITIILDRSGSMASVAEDTIGGFNRFLDDQRKVPGSANITLHQFDHEFETVMKGEDIQKAKSLTGETFVPRGSTALLDAIGRGIGETGSRLGSDPAQKVVFVIITDGHENASQEYTPTKVHEMIEHQRTKYAWEFVFLGANQDAIKAATNLGVPAGNAMKYASNAAGTKAAFASAGSNLIMYRCSMSADMAFNDKDKEEQYKAGAEDGSWRDRTWLVPIKE